MYKKLKVCILEKFYDAQVMLMNWYLPSLIATEGHLKNNDSDPLTLIFPAKNAKVWKYF